MNDNYKDLKIGERVFIGYSEAIHPDLRGQSGTIVEIYTSDEALVKLDHPIYADEGYIDHLLSEPEVFLWYLYSLED